MPEGAVGEAVAMYGVQFAMVPEEPPPSDIEGSLVDAVIEYGVVHGEQDMGVTHDVGNAQMRDDWWKWAVGAGVVSVAAYAIYRLVTKGER